MREITIKPVSRVAGNAKITIHLNDEGEVADSRFHVVEFRGFEKFCEGRMFWEMPLITSRICGVCPVSHHLASVKACDDLLKLDIPPAAKKLRELLMVTEYLSSHTAHFFYFAGPDFFFGPESDPSLRNIVSLIEAKPEITEKAIRLRQLGRTIIEQLGGSSIQPVTAIPGGMSKPLHYDDRFVVLKEVNEALELARFTLGVGKEILDKFSDFGDSVPTKYLSLSKQDNLELYDGMLKLIDSDGNTIEEFDPRNYLDYIGEHVEDWSYAKFPFYAKSGYPDGMYRCGPLARLNVAGNISTPEAGNELKEFKKLGDGGPVHKTIHYHYARLIEVLYAAERARELLLDDEIVSPDVRVKASRTAGEGIGVVEAPRGVLIHHYQADEAGKLEKVNLVVATTNNNLAINTSLKEVAKKFVSGDKLTEGALNKVEMAIRSYDPCLSCSTHMIGQMPLEIVLLDPNGHQLDMVGR